MIPSSLVRKMATAVQADQIDTWYNPTQNRVGILLHTDSGEAMWISLSAADAARIGQDMCNLHPTLTQNSSGTDDNG